MNPITARLTVRGGHVTDQYLVARADWPVGRALFTETTVGVDILFPDGCEDVTLTNCRVDGFATAVQFGQFGGW